MSKYSDQTKLAAADDYCRGHSGLKIVARRHGVNVASLRLWAAAYRVHGAAGVQTKQRSLYSAEFKMAVLQRIREENLSHRQAAALFNIRNRDIIGAWQRQYEVGSTAALAPHTAALPSKMSEKVSADGKLADDDARTRQELLEELKRLRVENAYLKKLEALAQANKQPRQGNEPEPC